MAFEDSPSLESLNLANPSKLPDPGRWRRRLIIALLSMLALVLVIEVIQLYTSSFGDALRGRGSIQGQVVDGKGQPLLAEVMILVPGAANNPVQTGITGADGHFQLSNVPAGSISVVAGYQGSGIEIPVNLAPGSQQDVGQIKIQTTATP